MEARLNRIRAAIAARRWRARLILWSAYALVALAHPYAPDESSRYLYLLIGLSVVAGALYPRAFIATGVGLYAATLVRMGTLPESLYPYISVEMAIVPLFAGLARLAVWTLVDRKYRTLLSQPATTSAPDFPTDVRPEGVTA